MRFKSFKIGKSKEKSDGDGAEAGEALTTEITDLQEHLDDKTKNSEEPEQELKELSDTANESEKGEDTSPQPHGPLDELSVEPEDQLQNLDEETVFSTTEGEAGEEVQVVKVGAEAVAPAEAAAPSEADAKAEAEKGPVDAGASDSLNNLFGDEEEEENPLANLINALPDVTTQELLDDLQEIKEIIKESQQN